MSLHISQSDDDLPDAGEGMCCMGAAVYGPGRCTCWEEAFDLEQSEPQEGPHAIREKACHDCAFRSGSPEQEGDPRYAHSAEGDLEEIISGPGVFYCHQGMRRVVRLVHPSGVAYEPPPCAFRPPVRRGSSYCGNGEPAAICAGWAAKREAFLRER